MDLQLLLAFLDSWIATFEFWRGKFPGSDAAWEEADRLERALFEAVLAVEALTKEKGARRSEEQTAETNKEDAKKKGKKDKILEHANKAEVAKKAAEALADKISEKTPPVLEALFNCFLQPIPISPNLLAKAIWIVGLKLGNAPLDIFDVFYQRTVASRLEIVDSMLRHRKERGFKLVPQTSLDAPLIGWMPHKETVLCTTIASKNYAGCLSTYGHKYSSALERALGLAYRPIGSIVELGMCNIWLLTEELCGKQLVLQKESNDLFMSLVTKGGLKDWWGFEDSPWGTVEIEKNVAHLDRPPSPTTSRRRMHRKKNPTEDDVWQRDIVFCEAVLATLKKNAQTQDIFLFVEAFMRQSIFCKHASGAEAAVHAMGLGSPSVTSIESAFTEGAGDLNADFGHLDYIFGRLEMIGGDHSGKTRYGKYHFCIDIEHLGPQIFISLHDQGKPFSRPELAESKWDGPIIRKAGPLDRKFTGQWFLDIRQEWRCQYLGGFECETTFLDEIFYGPRGIKLGLALSIACEFKRAKQALPMLKGGEAWNELVKQFFRPQILVPCVLPLDHVTVTSGGVDRQPHQVTMQPHAFDTSASKDEHLLRQKALFQVLQTKVLQLCQELFQNAPCEIFKDLEPLLAKAAEAVNGNPNDIPGIHKALGIVLENAGGEHQAVKRLISALMNKLGIIFQVSTKGGDKVLWNVILHPPDDDHLI